MLMAVNIIDLRVIKLKQYTRLDHINKNYIILLTNNCNRSINSYKLIVFLIFCLALIYADLEAMSAL